MMGKKCIIKTCPSRSKLKRKKGAEPLSYFRASNPTRLKNWRKSLGIDLKRSDNICHLHFKQEHIKMYDELLINGELKVIPVTKNMLREEALPTIEHQFIPKPVDHLKLNVIKEEGKAVIMTDHNYHKEKNETELQHNKDSPDPTQIIHNNEISPDNNIEKCDDEPSINKQTNNRIVKKKSNKIFAIEETNTSLVKKKTEEISSIEQTSNRLLKKNETIENLKHVDIFSMPIFLPPLWLYEKTPTGLEFMRLNPALGQITNRLRINKDLSVTIIFPNNGELLLNEKLSKYRNTYDYLKYVENWPQCVGTGFDSKKYADNCKGVIVGDEKYIRQRIHPRCKSCRLIRKQLQNRKQNRRKNRCNFLQPSSVVGSDSDPASYEEGYKSDSC